MKECGKMEKWTVMEYINGQMDANMKAILLMERKMGEENIRM